MKISLLVLILFPILFFIWVISQRWPYIFFRFPNIEGLWIFILVGFILLFWKVLRGDISKYENNRKIIILVKVSIGILLLIGIVVAIPLIKYLYYSQ